MEKNMKNNISMYLYLYLNLYLYLYIAESLCCTPETKQHCKPTIFQQKINF